MKASVATKKGTTMKINVNNLKAVTAAIKNAEAMASARLLDPTDVEWVSEKAEQKLEALCIPKKHRIGCRAYLNPSKVCNKYKWNGHGTYAVLERFPSGWFMIRAYRDTVCSISYGSPSSQQLTLSEEAKKFLPTTFKL